MKPVAALLVALLTGCVSAAVLEELPSAPVEGHSLALAFVADGRPASGMLVKAKYRENAHAVLQHEQTIGTTDADGRVQWTPEQPGVVVLSWDGGTRNVSVRHDGIQPAAILIALFAGVLLLGGSALFFLRMLMLDESAVAPSAEPPST